MVTREAAVKATQVRPAQAVNPPKASILGLWSRLQPGCSAQTPAGAHYLVPGNTGDLETGSLGSCSITVCVTLRESLLILASAS